MSEAGNQQEPSMEEILASIRKIISEDGDEAPQADAGPPPEPAPQEEPLELLDEVTQADEPLELTEEAPAVDDGEIEIYGHLELSEWACGPSGTLACVTCGALPHE